MNKMLSVCICHISASAITVGLILIPQDSFQDIFFFISSDDPADVRDPEYLKRNEAVGETFEFLLRMSFF